MIGESLRRFEDPRLIQGQGQYVDDLTRADGHHAVFVRSPEAHARILGVETEEARSMPGVAGVFVGADLELLSPMPNLFPAPLLKDSKQGFALAVDEVAYVGEAVVVVVAKTGRPEMVFGLIERSHT